MEAVEINLAQADEKLNSLLHALTGNALLFKRVAGALEYQTELNFEVQGRPRWKPLAPSTVAARKKRNSGSSVLQILQDRGFLAASVSSEYGGDFAGVGAGGAAKDYAAIQQLSGDAGKGHHTHIDARPYLPFTGTADAATLQPEALDSVLTILSGAASDAWK